MSHERPRQASEVQVPGLRQPPRRGHQGLARASQRGRAPHQAQAQGAVQVSIVKPKMPDLRPLRKRVAASVYAHLQDLETLNGNDSSVTSLQPNEISHLEATLQKLSFLQAAGTALDDMMGNTKKVAKEACACDENDPTVECQVHPRSEEHTSELHS